MRLIDEAWARAFARQALSDLRALEILGDEQVEKCHRLHFLQMAAEKACKAHLVIANGHQNVRKSHAYIASRTYYPVLNPGARIPRWELDLITKLAREIELLAPACDDGYARRDNSEYPWEGANGEVHIPSEYNFPNIDDGIRSTVRLIRLIRTAAESYSK